jgi:hypothetical protein
MENIHQHVFELHIAAVRYHHAHDSSSCRQEKAQPRVYGEQKVFPLPNDRIDVDHFDHIDD